MKLQAGHSVEKMYTANWIVYHRRTTKKRGYIRYTESAIKFQKNIGEIATHNPKEKAGIYNNRQVIHKNLVGQRG